MTKPYLGFNMSNIEEMGGSWRDSTLTFADGTNFVIDTKWGPTHEQVEAYQAKMWEDCQPIIAKLLSEGIISAVFGDPKPITFAQPFSDDDDDLLQGITAEGHHTLFGYEVSDFMQLPAWLRSHTELVVIK